MTADETAFAIAIGALRPYLSELVVIGGWAHRLFRRHPGCTAPDFSPLVTDDADIAVPLTMKKKDRAVNELLAEAGFVEDLSDAESPPVSRFVLEQDQLTFELEFVANLVGSTVKRGKRDVTTEIAGATAQKLRHIDALLVSPWAVTLDAAGGYAIPGGAADVRIPNPASYLFQKLIVLPKRIAKGHGDKDLLYIFDTLQLFASELDMLRAPWLELETTLSASTKKDFALYRESYFQPSASVVIAAAQVARASGRTQPPDASFIAAACRAGFDQIFE